VKSVYGKLVLAAGAAGVGVPVAVGDLENHETPEVSCGIVHEVYVSGSPLVLIDARVEPNYDNTIDVPTTEKAHGVFTTAVHARPPHSEVEIMDPTVEPMSDEPGEILGVLQVLSRPDGKGFSEADQRLLEGLAVEAGIYMQTAREMNAADRGLEMTTAALELAEKAMTGLPTEDLLGACCTLALKALKGEGASVVFSDGGGVYDEECPLRRLRLEEDRLIIPGKLLKLEKNDPRGPGIVRRTLTKGITGLCTHVKGDDPVVNGEFDLQPHYVLEDKGSNKGAAPPGSSLFILPLTTAEGSVFAAVIVYGPKARWLDGKYGEVEIEEEEGILLGVRAMAREALRESELKASESWWKVGECDD